MRQLGPLLTLAFLLALPLASTTAQDMTIRAKMVTFPDGSYAEKVVDPREKTMRETTYDASGKVTEKVLHRLDDDLQPVESFTYNAAGKPLYRTELKRNAANQITEGIDYTPTNKLIRRIVYSYDSFGKLTGVKTYDSNGKEVPTPKKRAP